MMTRIKGNTHWHGWLNLLLPSNKIKYELKQNKFILSAHKSRTYAERFYGYSQTISKKRNCKRTRFYSLLPCRQRCYDISDLRSCNSSASELISSAVCQQHSKDISDPTYNTVIPQGTELWLDLKVNEPEFWCHFGQEFVPLPGSKDHCIRLNARQDCSFR